MSILSISNVIRVTVQGVERSLSVKNVNEVALFTHETPNNVEPYMITIDPSDIVTAYGTNSLTAKMAQNVFAQNANLNSGRGYLVVIPMQNATSATNASFATPVLTSNLTAIKAVTAGSLKITVDSVDNTLSNLDFSACSTVDDVAKVISNATKCCFISVNAGKIVFASKKVGSGSSIVLSSGVGGTDISGSSYLDVSNGTTTNGTNSSGETISEAITRMKDKVSFTGVMTTLSLEDTAFAAVSTTINAGDYIFVHPFTSTVDIAGAITTVKNATQTKTRCLLYTNGIEDAKLFCAAYVGRAFSVNFSGSFTSQTMNLKTLVNVLPDDGLTQTDYTNAKAAGADLYVNYQGAVGVLSSGGNSYFDVVYENLALKYAAQYGLFNALKTTGTKIPQTETGMSVLRDALAQVFIQFARNGVIAPGTWNSAQTFGDPATFRKNISEVGWYIYSLPITQQAQSEREQRIAPVIQGACKRAGAIHEADILIVVEE
jgi:hypothetical protein